MRVRGYAPATPCWSELVSSDLDASIAFYGGLFDWQVTDVDGGRIFHLNGVAVAGLSSTSVPGQPSWWLTYISTEDAAETAGSVAAGAGTVLRPPTDVGSRGRLALLADPEGAVFGAWQRGTFAGAQVVNEPNTVCWSEVMRRDVAGAVEFYGRVFGWVERAGDAVPGVEYSEWLSGGRAVAGMTAINEALPPDVPAHWRTILEVDDCAATVERCLQIGGQVPMEPLDLEVGHYAQIVDPQGAAFGVVELVPELRGLVR